MASPYSGFRKKSRIQSLRGLSMNASEVWFLAFLIGVVAGLRSLTAPAVLAWGAQRNWLNVHNTPLSFMASTAAMIIFVLLAVAELIADQLPSTPSRTAAPGLIARIATGGLCGTGIAAAGMQSLALGAVLGIVGALVGTFGGYQLRTRLVKALKVPDLVIATLEDVVAIGGACLSSPGSRQNSRRSFSRVSRTRRILCSEA
jgi:uncharacterized membrane protein